MKEITTDCVEAAIYGTLYYITSLSFVDNYSDFINLSRKMYATYGRTTSVSTGPMRILPA